MTLPEPSQLAEEFEALVQRAGITVGGQDENVGLAWHSGVYALLDCVFSAQARYNSVVLPMLRKRLPARPGMQDVPELTFSAFIEDVDSFGEDKFERYSKEVFNRQKLARRLKTEVCYEGATFFSKHGYETMADLRALSDEELEILILTSFQPEVRGIGPTLAHYLLMLLGKRTHVKLDVMILRFWDRMNGWRPNPSNSGDYALVQETLQAVASKMGTSAQRLDNAIWQYESTKQGGTPLLSVITAE